MTLACGRECGCGYLPVTGRSLVCAGKMENGQFCSLDD